MRRHSYDITSKEIHLRHKLAEETRRADQLAQDSTGVCRISALEEELITLKSQLKETDALRIKCEDLVAENKRLKAANKEYRANTARLKADLALAYQMEREAYRDCEKLKKARLEWAEKARLLATRLSLALAEKRRLKAKLNRSPQNSSMPPSASPNVKKTICNSREKTNRKPGAQPGHKGHKRRARVADEVVYLDPLCVCPKCLGLLEPDGDMRTRQLTDLVITVRTVEYVAKGHVCTSCGKHSFASFPKPITNEVNFGNTLRAVTTFLYGSCNISKAKTASFIYEATGGELTLSEGSIHNFFTGFSKKAEAAISDIVSEISSSDVVGSDATHTRCDGHQSYIYNFNSKNSAIYKASEKKGLKPLEESLLKDYQGTIVHDHDMSYYSFGGGHQECNVHILRALKGVCENEPEVKWAKKMRALLCKANSLCKKARKAGAKRLDDNSMADIEAAFDDIIAVAEGEYATASLLPAKYRPEGIALQKRLKEYKSHHLTFIHDLSVPFDNNRSERDLRCVKNKTKQAGGFRSVPNGEALYCDYLSVAQTAKLREMSVLATVRDIFDGNSAMFKFTNAAPP